MSKLRFLATSQNQRSVLYDPVDSHAATHFEDTPNLRELTIEVIGKTALTEEVHLFDTDMGRVVGTSDLVTNEPGDEIVFAIRKNRTTYTSFNKSKSPVPCSIVAAVLKQHAGADYELLSAWIGSVHSPSFPGDEYETPDSKPFWLAHSLAWGRQEVIAGTETSVCPW